MKAMIDLNVMLDFLQRREPFFEDAACVMDAVLYKQVDGVLPTHAITTLHYFLARGADKSCAREAIRWMLETFEIAACDADTLVCALALEMPDFEDAVTSILAQRSGCTHIVTRNMRHFSRSPIPALIPADFLRTIENA